MTSRSAKLLLGAIILLGASFAAAEADGSWLKNVDATNRAKTNPYAQQPDAILAGRRIYVGHCARCHGDEAEGVRKRPALKSERIQQQATEGDLHWILVNGNMRKGMPSWAKLPDQQLWQLISYVKSLH